MKLIKDLKYRLLSFGEGIRGMRPNKEQNDERSVATEDDSSTSAGKKIKHTN
jgi:hypothetical protein